MINISYANVRFRNLISMLMMLLLMMMNFCRFMADQDKIKHLATQRVLTNTYTVVVVVVVVVVAGRNFKVNPIPSAISCV